MRSRPYDADRFELDDLLDDVFQLSWAHRERLKAAFRGEVTLDEMMQDYESNHPEEEEIEVVDFSKVLMEISTLRSENWQKVQQVLMPTPTPGIHKLLTAIANGSDHLVKLHLDGKWWHQQVSVDAVDEEGRSPLYMAWRNFPILDELLRRGANPQIRTTKGVTALMAVASAPECSADYSKALIKRGARINAQDEEGNTALHAACGVLPSKYGSSEGALQNIDYLLESGADPRLRRKHQKLRPIDRLHEVKEFELREIKIGKKEFRQKMQCYEQAVERLNIAEARFRHAVTQNGSPHDKGQREKASVTLTKSGSSKVQRDAAEANPLIKRLATLKQAFDQGLLTEKEYEAKKAKLLEEL